MLKFSQNFTCILIQGIFCTRKYSYKKSFQFLIINIRSTGNLTCRIFFLTYERPWLDEGLKRSILLERNLKPCPFGLIKRLDPVVVIFFKKCQKIYKCWIKCISKKFTTTGSANTCKFFWKWKNFDLKKNYNYGIKAPLKSHSCNFFWNQNFFISKKNYKCWLIQSL